MKKKIKAFSQIKKYIIFIQNQTGKWVKHLKLDNGLEYSGTDFLKWFQKQDIHYKPKIFYLPEIKRISKRFNGVINTKA